MTRAFKKWAKKLNLGKDKTFKGDDLGRMTAIVEGASYKPHVEGQPRITWKVEAYTLMNNLSYTGL